jgi:hypothetical protein
MPAAVTESRLTAGRGWAEDLRNHTALQGGWMRTQVLALAACVALVALAAPARAQQQQVDLGLLSLEVRGDAGRPGGQLSVTARIARLERGGPESVIAILRFQSPGEPRPFAERRVPLAPGARVAVTVPWTARVGRHVVSVSIAVGTNLVVDRQPRNDTMTTRDVVIFARGGRGAPRDEPPTEIGARALAAASAPPTSVAARGLAIASAPAALVAASGLSAASAPPGVVATAALGAASAPVVTLATGTLGAASAPVIALATGGLSASSAPAAPVTVPALTSVSAPALAVDVTPLGAESRAIANQNDQPSDQPSDRPADQPTGNQPARQP